MDFTARNKFRQPGSKFVSRNDAEQFSLEIIRGLRFKAIMQLLEFDPLLGSSKPVDLTGSKFEMKMYEMPKMTLTLTQEKDGEEPLEIDLPLSKEETSTFLGAKSEREREIFMKELAERRRFEIMAYFAEAREAEQLSKDRDDPE